MHTPQMCPIQGIEVLSTVPQPSPHVLRLCMTVTCFLILIYHKNISIHSPQSEWPIKELSTLYTWIWRAHPLTNETICCDCSHIWRCDYHIIIEQTISQRTGNLGD